MAFKPFKQTKVPPSQQPTAKQINDLQSNIAETFAQLLGKDQLDSQVLKNITLQPGQWPNINKVSHGLGRALTGYIVCRTHNGYAFLTDFQDRNPSPSLLLYLQVPAVCTVDLLVF